MGRSSGEYLAMKTDVVGDQVIAQTIKSDIDDLKVAAKNLIKHATKLGGLGFGTSFLKWIASFVAIFRVRVEILDATTVTTICLTGVGVQLLLRSTHLSLHNSLKTMLELKGSW